MKNIRRALKYIPDYKKKVALALTVGVISALIVTAIPLAIQKVMNNLLKASAEGRLSPGVFVWPFGAWLSLRLLMMISDWLREIIEDNLFRDAVVQFRLAVMSRLDTLSISYFEKHRSGQIISEVNQSPSRFGDWLTSVVDNYLSSILNALFALAVLAYKFPPIAIVILVLAAIYAAYIFGTMKRNRSYWKVNRNHINEYTGIAIENVSFISHIRALGISKSRSQMFSKEVRKHDDNLAKMFSFQHRRNFGGAVIELLLYAVPILIFAVRSLNGQQEATDIYVLAIYMGTISGATARLVRIWNNTVDVNDTVGDTLKILDNIDAVADPATPERLERLGVIAIEDMSFSYQGTKSEAIKNFSLSINPGEVVALVGRSGSGKSTITKLLLRFYDPTNGSISVDGKDLRTIAQEDLRQRFGVVMQDVALFNDTVANNIAVAQPSASRREIIAAAKLAYADGFIKELPDGYDTLVGERGVKLSGGEKQRISIARAILRNPEAVLLDEATSALDSESEKYVQEGLSKLLKDRTALIIAHRLSTIAHADKVVVMDKGRVVEVGSYNELKERGGLFSELLAHQQL